MSNYNTSKLNHTIPENYPHSDAFYISPEPPPRSIQLEIVSENNKKRIAIDFQNSPLVIGRREDTNPVELDMNPHDGLECGVSRRHAILTYHDDGLFIQDMKSTNGTRINGFSLIADRDYRLRNGDEVEFGQLRAIIRFIQ